MSAFCLSHLYSSWMFELSLAMLSYNVLAHSADELLRNLVDYNVTRQRTQGASLLL